LELNVAAPKVKGFARYLVELRSILLEMSIKTWIFNSFRPRS
jgi:hypothetical protein